MRTTLHLTARDGVEGGIAELKQQMSVTRHLTKQVAEQLKSQSLSRPFTPLSMGAGTPRSAEGLQVSGRKGVCVVGRGTSAAAKFSKRAANAQGRRKPYQVSDFKPFTIHPVLESGWPDEHNKRPESEQGCQERAMKGEKGPSYPQAW